MKGKLDGAVYLPGVAEGVRGAGNQRQGQQGDGKAGDEGIDPELGEEGNDFLNRFDGGHARAQGFEGIGGAGAYQKFVAILEKVFGVGEFFLAGGAFRDMGFHPAALGGTKVAVEVSGKSALYGSAFHKAVLLHRPVHFVGKHRR